MSLAAITRAEILTMAHISANTQTSTLPWACTGMYNHCGEQGYSVTRYWQVLGCIFMLWSKGSQLWSRKPSVIRVHALPEGGFNKKHNFLESCTPSTGDTRSLGFLHKCNVKHNSMFSAARWLTIQALAFAPPHGNTEFTDRGENTQDLFFSPTYQP